MTCVGTQFFYSDSDIKLLSTLNTSNFNSNIENFKGLLTRLDSYTEHFPTKIMEMSEISKTAFGPFKMFSVPNMTITHKQNLQFIFEEIRHIITNCKLDLQAQIDEASESILDTSTGKKFKKFKRAIDKISEIIDSNTTITLRMKREIIEDLRDSLGGLLHLFTGVPGPKEYNHVVVLLNDLSKAVKGEHVTENMITKEIKDSSDILNQVIPLINTYVNRTDMMENEIDVLFDVILDKFKLDRFCLELKGYLDDKIMKEARLIKRIMQNSHLNLPDPYLFPKEKILSILHESNYDFGIEQPFFNEHQISEIYSLQSTMTIAHNEMIYSTMHIPVLDLTYSYSLISFPKFSAEDVHTIDVMSKLAMRPLDLIGCNDKTGDLTLFSSKDVSTCLVWNEIKICKHRHIKLHSGIAIPCSNHLLSRYLAYELSPDKILVKSEVDSELNVVCDSVTTKINVTKHYSIITLPLHCELYGNSFTVGRYKNDLIRTYNISIKAESVPLEKIDFMPTHLEVKNHSLRLGNLTEDFNNIVESNSNVSDLVRQIEADVYDPTIKGTMTKISLTSFVLTCIIIVMIIVFCFAHNEKLACQKCTFIDCTKKKDKKVSPVSDLLGSSNTRHDHHTSNNDQLLLPMRDITNSTMQREQYALDGSDTTSSNDNKDINEIPANITSTII